MTQQIAYQNGLRLVLYHMPAVRSVTLGVWVGAGSAYETDSNNGISHFIEHMMFKGTPTRSAFRIAEEMDAIGAQLNAFTAKEYTCYYTKSVDTDAEHCFDLLSDMYYRSLYADDEIARERQVILEEISMVEDSPEDVCMEMLATSIFGAHGTYGRTILGSKKTVSAFSEREIRDYLAARYVPDNTVIAVAGHMTLEEADVLVRRYFDTEAVGAHAAKVVYTPRKSSNILVKKKSVEQTSVGIGFPSLCYDDPALYAVQAAGMCLGGGMSSRLFQEVREKKGLAYSVYSYVSAALTDGTFTLYCGTNPAKARDAAATMAEVTRKLRENGLEQAEFERGRAQIKGNFVLGQESSYSLMSSIGKYAIMTGKLFDVDGNYQKIENLTKEECDAAIRRVTDFNAVCVSVVGSDPDKTLIEAVKG